MKLKKSKSARTLKNRGFALVVTLSLMILLTVIAVGLLGLSSVSLRSMNRSSAMTEARQNARMALMLAIGELQKAAGPDQRITATADIAGDTIGQSLAAGAAPLNDKSINNVSKGLSAVQSGTRHWTGVWKNANTSATAGNEVYTKTPSPQFVQWLISGNETTGSMTPSSAMCSISSEGSVSDPKTAVVLVGRKTAGDPSSDTLARYVAAPLVPITTMKGNNVQTVGRYGWWVGDEGVKAKINTPTTVIDNTSYASLSPQRRGWETVAGFADYPTPSSGTFGSLANVITLSQTALLVPSATDASSGVSPLQSAFHSATTDSKGLLTDTLNGGTKIDLTTVLSGNLPTTNPVSSIANYPVKGTNIIPRVAASTLLAPKWDTLKEFYDRSKSLENGSLVVKAATSNTGTSIAPLITDIRLLMGVKFVPVVAGFSYKANACGKIAIGIANPYSLPLKWNNDLEFEVRNLTPTGNNPARIYNLGSNSVFISSTEPAVFNKAVFRIKASSLAPGEARGYTIGSAFVRAIGTGAQRAVIDLTPFGSSSPADFTKCVELDAPGVYTSLPSLDVRENWQTTLIGVDMRLAGSSSSAQPLRRVEAFELDNGYFAPNTRNYTKADAQSRPKPVPLMCYSFQLSQPGVDYLNLMPSGYALGQRSSTLRTFADFNLQATRISRPITSYNAPPYFMESNNGFGQLPDNPSGQTGQAFTKNLDSTMPWGRSWIGSPKTVIFSVPTQFTSLAQFQHADLTGDSITASVGHQPGNAFGNSYATPFVKRALTTQPRTDYILTGAPSPSGSIPTARTYYDISYLLNASIWDSYFFSTINSSANGQPENPALVRVNPDAGSALLADPVKCASQLMVDGAFNVNCTDKNAWKAFLASSKHFKHKADTAASTNAAFPRSLDQLSPAATGQPTGVAADSFSGFRRLTDGELDSLAAEIVKQVRLRGPFVSLSHFVNRAIADIRRQPALTRSGALQQVIDESGATINFAGSKKGLTGVVANTDRVALAESGGAPRADMDGGKTVNRPADVDSDGNPVWAATSTDRNYGAVASIIADRVMLSSSKNEQGYRSTGIPGWLTQADVLQVIGPSITNRSDTFRIRAYGESLDSTGKPLAKAYCEAVVQRQPNYVDSANAPADRGVALTNLNNKYGRQFQIVSFRWLSPQEI